MRLSALFVVAALGLATSLAAQQPVPSLQDRVRAAQAQNAALDVIVDGADAARSLKNFTQADSLVARGLARASTLENGLVNQAIEIQLVSGGGINAAQRKFRELRQQLGLQPQQIVAIVGGYPELLVGGQLDEEIRRLSPDAQDPRYRCTCYAVKAWMHRIAGDMATSRVYSDSLTRDQDRNPPAQETALNRANRARDLARAGRTTEARAVMERALAMDKIEQMTPIGQYRWAQAFTELREIDRLVEVLDRMLKSGELVTVRSLEVRVSFDHVRSEPKFQALLARHRSPT
jgi:hypothetical protein